MRLGDLLSKICVDYFYLMHLSYGYERSREPLWRYASDRNRIGLDYFGIDRNWRDIPEHERRSKLNWFWYDQFKLFCETMTEGDCVLVMEGLSRLLGVGLVGEPYSFGEAPKSQMYTLGFFRHVRPVRWLIKYKYEERVPFKVPTRFENTIAIVDSGSPRWALVNRELKLTDRQLVQVLGETEEQPIIERPRPPTKQEIEQAKDRLRSRRPEPRIEIEHEISTIISQGPTELPRILKRKTIIRAGSESLDINAGIDLAKSDVQIDVNPVYVPTDLSKSTVRKFENDAREFRRLISKIECMFGLNGFTNLCIDYTLSRDAFGLKRCVLCNLAHYQRRKSFSFWLITLAREFAYLMHRRRDMRHMNLMRELLAKALDRCFQNR